MHKVRINIMLCLRNSTVVNPRFQTRREISDLFKTNMYIFTPQDFSLYLLFSLSSHLPSLIFFRFLSCNFTFFSFFLFTNYSFFLILLPFSLFSTPTPSFLSIVFVFSFISLFFYFRLYFL